MSPVFQTAMKTVSLVFALACSAPAPAGTLHLNPKRLIEVIDVIEGGAVAQAQQVHDLAEASKAPIDFLINSPGGAVTPGYMLVDAMDAARKSGVKIRCAVGVLAASMAFNLLAHCDERFALRHAAMLFHPPRIFARGPMTVRDLDQASDDLKRILRKSTPELLAMVGMSKKEFYRHFHAETLWTAEQLADASGNNWLKIVDDIDGSKLVFTFQQPRLSIFGEVDYLGVGNWTIIHISNYPLKN